MRGSNDTSIIKGYPIGSVLRSLGYPYDIPEGKASVLIPSPFHEESNPSFHLNVAKNLWFDFSINTGGSNIDLVCMFKHCSIREAIEYIRSISDNLSFEPVAIPKVEVEEASGISIDRIENKVVNRSLLEYATSRAIPANVLNRYCSEVHYTNVRTGKNYFAIGFPNNRGGWILRNRYFKASTHAGCTFLGPNGKLTQIPLSESVLVFEGFFNFLSHVAIFGSTKSDVIILNSVSNIGKATSFFQEHDSASLWLDNDKAGRNAATRLIESAPRTSIVDRSSFYRWNNDLNEFLCGKLDSILDPEPPKTITEAHTIEYRETI